MQVTIDQPIIQVEVTNSAGPSVIVEVTGVPVVALQVGGMQGPRGPLPSPGAGLVLVGDEFRLAISNLPRG